MNQDQIDALIAKYHSWRNEIWLDVDDEIKGIKVYNMNLNHLLILDGLNSPFIKGGEIEELDALLFFWIISKEFSYNEQDRDKFFKKAKKIEFKELVKFLTECVEKSFGESDTMQSKSKSQTYFVAYFVDCFAREYGWSINEILKLPLGIAFQLITAINERNSSVAGKEYTRITELDNKINKYLLSSNSNNGIHRSL